MAEYNEHMLSITAVNPTGPTEDAFQEPIPAANGYVQGECFGSASCGWRQSIELENWNDETTHSAVLSIGEAYTAHTQEVDNDAAHAVGQGEDAS